MKRVLFVCVANTCRSAALEKILKKELGNACDVESCGVSAHGFGSPMDSRMAALLSKRGYETTHTARPICFEELKNFDYVFVATKAIKEVVLGDNVYLATHFSKKYKNQDVPDPYTSGSYEKNLEMLLEIGKSIAENI